MHAVGGRLGRFRSVRLGLLAASGLGRCRPAVVRDVLVCLETISPLAMSARLPSGVNDATRRGCGVAIKLGSRRVVVPEEISGRGS